MRLLSFPISDSQQFIIQPPNFVRVTLSFWGLMPIRDEIRNWASNLVRFYFYQVFESFEFVTYFVFISYLFVICR